jgi:hypothetical protein
LAKLQLSVGAIETIRQNRAAAQQPYPVVELNLEFLDLAWSVLIRLEAQINSSLK